MTEVRPYRVAVLWRGDREGRRAANPQNNRFHHIFEELAARFSNGFDPGLDGTPASEFATAMPRSL